MHFKEKEKSCMHINLTEVSNVGSTLKPKGGNQIGVQSHSYPQHQLKFQSTPRSPCPISKTMELITFSLPPGICLG